ncbi:hypothetical protein EGH24_04635 [Halonotius terrestris]|uniref:Uncharacterized protein n=1 Tax=Halonotius terrestris TaxID=2487750 RepID=A0A8J8PAJ7_9EURY|nr:hypothetical protein [Halonotius terrestris]TQQ82736.1 hypothetical protein EGH24_04635 [Halonotius terrestris]
MVPASRRGFVLTLSAGSSVGLAGCLSAPENQNSTSTDTESEPDPSDDSVQSLPDFPEDTASDDCPPFDDADQVACYDAVDPESIPLVLIPETQSVQPNESTDFTLRNRSDQQFNTNIYAWQLYKRVDGEWYYVMPQESIQPLTPLEAGDDHTWTATVETGRVSDGEPIEELRYDEPLTTAGLGGGHYAFGIDGWFTAGSTEESIAVAAGFELETDPLELAPTSAISETEWNGETLVARSTRGEPDDDSDQPEWYILERIEQADTTPERVIVEQVVRNHQLRDAIALSRNYDANRVRIEEFSRAHPPFGIDDVRYYEFQGTYYRVTTTEGSS